MHIQIFLVVVLLTLGTANKEESFADRTLLRQLLRGSNSFPWIQSKYSFISLFRYSRRES